MGRIMSDDDGQWLSIGQAAQALGIGRAAIYGRIKRSTIKARRSNDGATWQVLVDGDTLAASQAAAAERHGDTTHDDRVAAMRIDLARAEERMAALTRELEGTAGRLAGTEAELARARQELADELRRSIWSRLFGRR